MSYQRREIIALRNSLEIQREALILKKVVIDSSILAKKIYTKTEINRLENKNLKHTISELSLFAGKSSNDFLIMPDNKNLIIIDVSAVIT